MSGILEQETVMGIVEAKNLTFEYIRRDEEGNVEGITTAVDNVNIDIKAGDFVAVLGHNGSGKSTFALKFCFGPGRFGGGITLPT